MDIVIPGHRIKAFTRSLASINKIGDELSFHVTAKSLKLSSLSSARSAFCLFTFEPSFFSRYRVTLKSSSDDPAAVQLQILGKTIHDIFKQKAVASANRIALSVSAADFRRAEAHAQDRIMAGPQECRLTITIFCPHGVKKTYKLTYAAGASLIALADIQDCANKITASPRTLKEWTDHFMLGRLGTDEITLWCQRSTCKLKSFEDANDVELNRGASINSQALGRQTISTSLTVAVDEFAEYAMGIDEALITVPLKEFKAIIDYTIGSGEDVDIHFNRGGDPLIAVLNTDGASIQFTLSTNPHDPAGIQKDRDVKPNLKQMRLPSAAPTRTSTQPPSIRGQSVHASERPSSTPHATPRRERVTDGRPLFNPPDADEEAEAGHRPSQGESMPPAEDDEDDMWDQEDRRDPTFSQMALNLDESSKKDEFRPLGDDDEETEQSLNPNESRTEQTGPFQSTARDYLSTVAPPNPKEAALDMSLDEDEADDSNISRGSLIGTNKRPRKNWQLGIT